MKKLVFLASAILLIAQLCSAESVCATADLASYIALGPGGCTIGANSLFDFQTLSGASGATPLSTTDITITPLGGTFDPGITTTTHVTASTGMLLEALFTYRISGNSYARDFITLANSSETGDGAVTDIQNFCAGGTFGPDGVTGCTGSAGTLLTLDGIQNQDSTSFGPVGLLTVVDDFTLDGGLTGSASGGSITDRFAAVPEPSSFLFTALGLTLAAGRKLRTARARACGRRGRIYE